MKSKNENNEKNIIENDDKKKKQEDSNIVYEYKKPEKDIRKIIPYCNNLFYITKKE